MSPVYIPPRDEEDAFFTRFEAARAQQAAHGYTPENSAGLVNGLTQMHRSYTDLPAGAKLSFAQAGKAPTDPVVVAAVAGARKRKAKKGFGWFGMGDVVRAGTGFLGEAVSDVADPFTTGVRGVVRTGLMALNAPFEEGWGLIRNIATSLPGQSGEVVAGAAGGAAVGSGLGLIGGPLAPVTSTAGAVVGGVIGGVAGLFGGEAKGTPAWGRSQSQLGVAAQAAFGGMPVEVGSGFLTGHMSPVAEEQRRRAKAAASIGDVGWTLGRQTANAVTEPGTTAHNILSGAIDASAAIRLDPATPLLRSAGMVNAARKTILPEHAVAWYASSAGQTLKAAVKGESNAWKLHHMFGRQLDPETLVRLADTADDAEIDKILTGKLGLDVRVKPKAEVSRRLARKRLSLDVPGGVLDFDDPRSFIDKADAFMANGKVDEATRLANNDNIIRALAGSITERKPAVDALMQSVEDTLKARGVPEAAARQMTRYAKETVEDNRLYTANEIGTGATIPGVVIDGETRLIQSPHSIAEYMNSTIPLPSHKDIGRAVSRIQRIYSVRGVVPTIEVTNALMGTVWRSMVLLRAALPVRVGGEEQARMAAASYDSVFSHPLSFIMRLVSDKKAGETGLGRVADISGVPLRDSEAAQAALNKAKGSDVFGNGSVVSMKHRVRYTPDNGDDYLRGWMDHETGILTADSIAIRLAKGESVDSVKAAFREGDLSWLRRDLAAAKDDVDLFSTPADMDRYVDSMADRLKYVSRDDPDILAHIAARGRNDRAKQSAADAMRRMVDEGVAPEKVVGDLSIAQNKTAKHYYDAATNKGFEYLHTKPTNYLARSKTFEQAYWKRVEELVPSMDEGARANALTFAAESKLPSRQIETLKARMAKHPPGTGPALMADDVDLLAKSHGLTATRDLLYDLSKRSQWADATRLVFPFAEAWKEMLVTWAKIIPDHPQVLRRLDQTVQGARGAGFFEVDPQTGQEMFTYPGSAFIANLVVGAPVPLKAAVSGLNLFASSPVMPGFGPVVQVAASWILPDKPEFDWVNEVISPYGKADTSTGFLESFAPAWFQKARKAFADPESDRVFANSVYDMARFLVSTGEYTVDSVEAQEETTAAARSMARNLYLLRTLASFTLPSAPQPQMVAQDKDGRIVTQFALTDEFRKLQDDPEVGWENAPQVFLEAHGPEALLFMQPKSRGGSPPVEDALDWVRSNPDLADRYKTTYGFFAPHSGEFSLTAYERQIATGERESLSPEEAMKLGQHRVASMKYRQAKDRVGPNPTNDQRKWLAEVKEALAGDHPGYEPMPRDIGKIDRTIRELADAVTDPAIAATSAGKAVAKYLTAREKAMDAAEASGLQRKSFARAKAMAPTRDWLRQVAGALQKETPDFSSVWDFVLSNELLDDTPETPEPTEEAAASG